MPTQPCAEGVPASIENAGNFMLALYDRAPVICSVLLVMLFIYPFYSKFVGYLVAKARLPTSAQISEQLSQQPAPGNQPAVPSGEEP